MNDEEIQTAVEASPSANRVTYGRLDECIADAEYSVFGTLTICVLTLENDFKVVGESACADPANFDEHLGRELALREAKSKIWPLEGYALRERMVRGPHMTVQLIAMACHEANRVYCASHGDTSQPTWYEAPEWQTQSAVQGVKYALENTEATSRSMHENWMRTKVADGWVYGEVKDPEAKTHPCLVEYDELPAQQRYKDDLFLAVVRSLSAN